MTTNAPLEWAYHICASESLLPDEGKLEQTYVSLFELTYRGSQQYRMKRPLVARLGFTSQRFDSEITMTFSSRLVPTVAPRRIGLCNQHLHSG